MDTAVFPRGGEFPEDLATQQCWCWEKDVWQGHLLATVPTAETFRLYVSYIVPHIGAPSGSMTSIVHFGSATSVQLPALYFLPSSTRRRACVDSRRDGAVCCDTENGLGISGYHDVYVQVVGELLSVSVDKELWCSTGNFTHNRVSDQPSVDVWWSSPVDPCCRCGCVVSLLHATPHVRPRWLSPFAKCGAG